MVLQNPDFRNLSGLQGGDLHFGRQSGGVRASGDIIMEGPFSYKYGEVSSL